GRLAMDFGLRGVIAFFAGMPGMAIAIPVAVPAVALIILFLIVVVVPVGRIGTDDDGRGPDRIIVTVAVGIVVDGAIGFLFGRFRFLLGFANPLFELGDLELTLVFGVFL